MKCQAGSSTSWNQDCWEKYQNFRWYHSNARKWRGTKEPLDEGERGQWQSWHTSRQTEVEKVETVTDFLFLGSKITVEDDCSHEIKRHLLLGRKAMTNDKLREHIIKQRHHFDRGWDGWMTSQWTWVWANSRRWWRTGRPGMLQSMGSQRVGQDWVTEQQKCVRRMCLPNNSQLISYTLIMKSGGYFGKKCWHKYNDA